MRLSSRLPPEPHPSAAELGFYARCLKVLVAHDVKFLAGGAYALKHHTGIVRETKDLDLFIHERDLPRTLEVLTTSGFRTENKFPHWLAKVYSDNCFIDLIFNSGNGLTPVDDAWFEHAPRGRLLGVDVAICPAEETIWSKSFVMERERYDGADVAHLLKACARTLDWDRLVARFGAHYRVLLSHLVLFGYVYPDESDAIPLEVMTALEGRVHQDRVDAHGVCRGTLLSREQYLVDLAKGERDGRLPPTGNMREADIESWTASIGDNH